MDFKLPKFEEILPGVEVLIKYNFNPNIIVEGSVHSIVSKKNDKNIIVRLKNGKRGQVIQVYDADKSIKKRIMAEDQYSENKQSFSSDIMKNDVIPKTVQSFLNSYGGYLYVGIRDTGTLKERLVGLKYEKEKMERKKGHMSDDKFTDYIEIIVRDALNKYLSSDEELDPLLEFQFPKINNIMIMEIHIAQSNKPFFYRNLSKKNILKRFKVSFPDDTDDYRHIDDFYIRAGNKKNRKETNEEFYGYLKEHFKGI